MCCSDCIATHLSKYLQLTFGSTGIECGTQGSEVMVVVNTLKFNKLSNFMYCFWTIVGETSGKFGVNLLKVIKPMYFKNLLLMRVVDFTPNMKTGSFHNPPIDELHVVEPMPFHRIRSCRCHTNPPYRRQARLHLKTQGSCRRSVFAT